MRASRRRAITIMTRRRSGGCRASSSEEKPSAGRITMLLSGRAQANTQLLNPGWQTPFVWTPQHHDETWQVKQRHDEPRRTECQITVERGMLQVGPDE